MAVAERGKGGFSRAGCGLLAAAILMALAFGADAEEAASLEPQAQSRAEYERIAREISVTAERMEGLTAEIAKVKKDHASLTAALIQSAKTERKLGQDIEDIATRLEGLKAQEDAIRVSLAARRGVLAEVLGALQRMGLNPPPAILVKPEDALASVRSAILLGAVVPELRHETDILIADLAELSRVAASIEAERERLTAAVGEQFAEKQRLGLLLAEKQRLRGRTGSSARRRAEALGGTGRQGQEPEGADSGAGARGRGRRGQTPCEAQKARREAELAALPVPEANRLASAVPFPALKGQLALPVTGRIGRRFRRGRQ